MASFLLLSKNTSMNRQHIIDAAEVVKSFGRAHDTVNALDGVSFTLKNGESVALLGPNGAGKTTLIDILLGLTTQTSGTLTAFGMTAVEAVKAGKISAVLQSASLRQDLKVYEVIEYIGHAYHRSLDVDSLLAQVHLGDTRGRYIKKLSGGEQQRLRFAIALLAQPELLILDEPTTGLDTTAREEFWASLTQYRRDGGTVLFATHYLKEAEQFADRIIMLNRGHVIADGPTNEIRNIAGIRHVSARGALSDEQRAQLTQRFDARFDADVVHIAHAQSDAAAKMLLDFGAHDLEIALPDLDEAFKTLLAKETAPRNASTADAKATTNLTLKD